MCNIPDGQKEFDSAALKFILKHCAPELESDADAIEVVSRDFSGAGFFVEYKRSPNPRCIGYNRNISTPIYADIAELKWGVGFVLYIADGEIFELEGFTHGPESWPSKITDYQFRDMRDELTS